MAFKMKKNPMQKNFGIGKETPMAAHKDSPMYKKAETSMYKKRDKEVDMSALKKADPPASEGNEVDKNKEAYKSFTSRIIAKNPQFEEVENPFYDEGEGGIKETGTPILDWENPAYDDIRDKFAYDPNIDYETVVLK